MQRIFVIFCNCFVRTENRPLSYLSIIEPSPDCCVLPHHQFFSAFGKDFKRKIDLAPDSADLIKYLRGEEIKTDCENGWAVVTVCGVPLGGAKVSNGVAKNHYPKGLRMLNA